MKPVFAGKTALVIGGTGGIGRALAMGLGERGAALTLTGGNSAERLEAVLAELSSLPGEISPRGFLCRIGGPGGFSPEDAARFILKRAGEDRGSPDILIAAWGPFKRLPLEKTSPEDWRFLTENNIIFPGILISALICGMISKGWGRILLFGGTNTGEIRGFTTTAAYSAAKTALGVLAKSAALRAGASGVTCNVICPGLTDTEYTGPAERDYNCRKSPGGKAMVPGEIARKALEILENPALNGAVIFADGGIRV